MEENIILNVSALMKVFELAFITFILAIALTPILSHFLYRFKIGKKIKKINSPIFSKLHEMKENTPTMGGLLIWISVLIITLIFNLSRSQTYLPLFALACFGVLGAFDDYLNVRGVGPWKGMRGRHKILWQLAIALIGAWWFYYKLGWNYLHIPGIGDFVIGWWYIPLFVFVILASTNAVNITDGLDGLAGGLASIVFLIFGGIAFVRGDFGLAAFCGTLFGATLAFLWFNIYPARFFMGDTGSMALGGVMGVIAMLTDTALVLPIIAFVFAMETMSVILQVSYKKVTGGKKIFLSAPLHHHFEAKGWPEPKVVMRFWFLGAVMAIIGFVIALIGRG